MQVKVSSPDDMPSVCEASKIHSERGRWLFSPLTPALSPLRGEGGKYLFPFNRRHGWRVAKHVRADAHSRNPGERFLVPEVADAGERHG